MGEQAPKTKLTPDRWARLKIVLDEALDRPASEREAFVEKSCGTDRALREEVTHLLISHEEAGAFLEEPTLSTSDFDGEAMERDLALTDRRVGTVLNNRYRVQRRLGAGGIGIVYLAEDLNLLARRVVVKFLHEQAEPDPARLRKFCQEIEALARIDHPGVVTAFDAGETEDGTPFLVMQYVEGRTLRKCIEAGPISFEDAASILRQLGEALQAAHDKRIMHRDLKPENVMLQQMGTRSIVKLIDFGIARVDESKHGGESSVLTIAGTPSYMAPEQLSGRPVLASDIFALGVIAYEMVVGKRPYPSKHPYQLRQQQKEGIVKGVMNRFRPGVPSGVEAGIRKALSFEAADRPKQAKEWCDSLAEALLEKNPGSSRRVLLRTGLGISIVGLAGVGGWLWNRSRHNQGLRGPLVAQHSGGMNPLEEGFDAAQTMSGSPIRNAERTGFSRWRIQTKEQASYNFPLSLEEKQEALRRGWKLTLTAYPEVGGVHAVVDFLGAGARFDISLYKESPSVLMLVACTQHVPTFEGARHRLSDAPHRCEMIYNPQTETAKVAVDGSAVITEYRGHRQQQTDRGFLFGASVWKSDSASGLIDLARFELLT